MAASNSRPEVADRRAELRGWLQLVLHTGAVTRAGRRRLAEQVADCDLSEQEFLVLWLCGDQSLMHRGQGELAEVVGVSAAQMSGLVERLRRRSLLRFERLGTDRRRQVWQLTDEGHSLLAELCQLLSSQAAELRGQLTSAEQLQLLALLERWLPAAAADQGGPSSCAA